MKTITIALAAFVATVFPAAKYPFPLNLDYKYGIRVKANATDIQKRYEEWLGKYYEEEGGLARIRWDRVDTTVSEGIAYGMLIMVYMDNNSNNTQEKFDRLWAYYKKFSNENGVMHWKVAGFDEVAGKNGATDAELDAAAALLMAHKQWGEDKYLDHAKTLILAIHSHEVNKKGYLKPGDAWDKMKNPSYFSTGAMELFKTASDSDWELVLRKSYELIGKARNPKTGLVPDWCDEDGGNLDTKFTWDALRFPWRMSWAYVWYGHAEAKKNSASIANWIQEETKGDIAAISNGYFLDGSRADTGRSQVCFQGAFTCAGMVDAKNQAWLDQWYAAVLDATYDLSYYKETMRLLFALLLSGNFHNFATVDGMQNLLRFKRIFNPDIQHGPWYTADGRISRLKRIPAELRLWNRNGIPYVSGQFDH